MANSRFEYVKLFERENFLLPETHIVIRVDGRGFHKLSAKYSFAKPNDLGALELMNRTAQKLMDQMPDISLAYGDSDEYSFLLRKGCGLFERREAKLITTFASTFTAYYQFYWPQYMKQPLEEDRLPTFDARAVVYPSEPTVRDYFAWRQVDCHINNLYNTTFWSLVEGGMTPKEAENELIGTLAADKNEILFQRFGINYNNEPALYKKGTVLIRGPIFEDADGQRDKSKRQQERQEKKMKKRPIVERHIDIIGASFWDGEKEEKKQESKEEVAGEKL
ncbi:unnamed protein product [Kuraishia capsulata CBS 1993]|uniref:tRNA(His) guanylyltransferase n=1 Tax=Kuraishia capsulata CBS 1993 TaxID=1382522 RepID=W6MHR6_9ASCO|nr:uncharacterized protein KUCA_T00001840001 [Kuraishia capsulata CBS 1993]CDK25869.1 unnamed protein product [Kuraishia capsulata CBS 1993]